MGLIDTVRVALDHAEAEADRQGAALGFGPEDFEQHRAEYGAARAMLGWVAGLKELHDAALAWGPEILKAGPPIDGSVNLTGWYLELRAAVDRAELSEADRAFLLGAALGAGYILSETR